MRALIRRTTTMLRDDDRGAGLVEYVMLVALIALVCIGGLTYFGSGTGGSLDGSSSCIVAAQDQQALPAGC